ncbi:DUF5994 family protein [Streptomyces resistomycificus]|uniref:DUF5994 family protein n=1 Tax=Streptomyces resistomycificus TaxID=67356 RepID=UPI000ABF0F0B|nr:DUF5994 family protein [Streptomyces resistomycificus]
MTTAPQPPLPSHPLLRLRLAPHGGMRRAVDGAWWPRSNDLLTELPRLLAGLPREWGHITSVTVNGATWPAVPGRMLVSNQVVRLHRTLAASATHTIVLLSPGQGHRDLLVVPPDTTAKAAEPLMTAAAAAGRQAAGTSTHTSLTHGPENAAASGSTEADPDAA